MTSRIEALAARMRDDAIETERDAAMRRRPVFERLEEKAEPRARILLADVEEREDPALQSRIVNTDAAAADFAAVQHQVVGLRTHRARLRLELAEVVVVRRRERMVHRTT